MLVENQDIVKQLNAVLKNKLTAINQYFLHARVLKHLGDVALADQEYKASIVAMKHSDMLVEHILSLGGLPNLQELGKLMVGETPDAMLRNDLKHAETSVAVIIDAIKLCESKASLPAINLLNKLLESHYERMDFIHAQINEPQLKKETA